MEANSHHELVIDPVEFFETCGDRSLSGLLFKKGLTPIVRGDTLTICFEKSSLRYRDTHGPRIGLVPEFSIPCFLKNVLTLTQARGIILKVKTVSWTKEPR